MLSFRYMISWMVQSRMTGIDLMIRIYLFLIKYKKITGIDKWHSILSVINAGIWDTARGIQTELFLILTSCGSTVKIINGKGKRNRINGKRCIPVGPDD